MDFLRKEYKRMGKVKPKHTPPQEVLLERNPELRVHWDAYLRKCVLLESKKKTDSVIKNMILNILGKRNGSELGSIST
jgi:hypothetical protein